MGSQPCWVGARCQPAPLAVGRVRAIAPAPATPSLLQRASTQGCTQTAPIPRDDPRPLCSHPSAVSPCPGTCPKRSPGSLGLAKLHFLLARPPCPPLAVPVPVATRWPAGTGGLAALPAAFGAISIPETRPLPLNKKQTELKCRAPPAPGETRSSARPCHRAEGLRGKVGAGWGRGGHPRRALRTPRIIDFPAVTRHQL